MNDGMAGEALERWLEVHGDELIAVRRRIHAHPELSGVEHETTRLVADRLALVGLVPRLLSSGTGLLCDVGTGDGPVIALRADLDALAMEDGKDVEYRSQTAGVAHACGHDVHTTVLLGAALYLAERWPADGPRLRLVFQPAEEELPGGANDVIADRGLDDVAVIYGLHCEPKLHTGTVGFRSGPITSATDSITVELSGPGGHTARPELTVDTISLVARIVTELPDGVRRRVGGEAALKMVFGAVHAGAAANVIPAHAVLRAAVRTPSLHVWESLPAAIDDELAALVDDPRTTCTVHHTRGVPPVVNDETAVSVARDAVGRTLGAAGAVTAPQSWGGDDFAWYTQRVPGAYLRLGTHDPAAGEATLDLHAGHFDVDERAIATGIRVLVATVEEQLRRM
jgi:amidohydrolase